jgi:hypothetical protein
MIKKITIVLGLSLLAACAPDMTRTTSGDIITVGHSTNDFSFALEHALEICTERRMNIRHIATEPGASATARTSRFECVKR